MYSELSSDIYINQLSVPGAPSVLAYNHGAAVREWTTSSANGSCCDSHVHLIQVHRMRKDSITKVSDVQLLPHCRTTNVATILAPKVICSYTRPLILIQSRAEK